jgi:uncharacterized protein YgiM (DUF1202 family)
MPSAAGATAEEMYAVATPALRLRSGPGLRFSTLATLSMGAAVQYLDDGGTADGYVWAKVRVVTSDRTGFVAFRFLAPIPSDGLDIGQMVHVEAGGGVGNLRSGPGTGHSVIRRVASGTTGTIQDGPVEADGHFWYKVRFGDATGWIVMAALAAGAGLDRAWVRANSGPLNVRNQPGLSGKILGHVSTGAIGFVTTDMPQEASGYVWVNVQFNGGLRGWVAKNFLTWL